MRHAEHRRDLGRHGFGISLAGRRQEILTFREPSGYPDAMTKDTTSYALSADGEAKIEAVDGYLKQAIADGRPLEALIATRRLGEVADVRAKEAARVATEGSWSVVDRRGPGPRSDEAGSAREASRPRPGQARRAAREARPGRASGSRQDRAPRPTRTRQLERVPVPSPTVDAARQRLSEWEHRKHEKLDRDVQKACEEIARAEQTVNKMLGKRSEA